MPCLPNMFRKKKKNNNSWTKEASEKLQDNLDQLVEQNKNLGQKIDECVNTARCNATCNRTVAYAAVENKKALEKTRGQIDNMVTIIKKQKNEVDYALRSETLKVCMRTEKKLKNASKIKSDRKQRKLIDDITNQHNMVNEITNTIRLSLAPDLTEEELAGEFERLTMEDNEKNKPSTSKTTELQKNKTTKLKKRVELPQ